MNPSYSDFGAWYEAGPGSKSKIIVAGKVMETDGSEVTLVRAEPQGNNPRKLLLKVNIKPYEGRFHPHIAIEKEIRYEELAEEGAFTDVDIQNKDNTLTLKIKSPPK
jgi:hypothetical protein